MVVPQDPISFSRYLVPKGLQSGERALLDDDSTPTSAPTLPPLNEAAFIELQEFGFSPSRAEKALRVTGNDNANVAMEWLLNHMEDPDIDVPYLPLAPGSQVSVDPEHMMTLMGMGFDERMATKALRETVFLNPLRLMKGWEPGASS